MEGAVDKIDSKDAQRLLLASRSGVGEVSMDDDLRRFLARLGLETNPEPTTAILSFAEAARRRGVCEDEESFGIAAPACQPLQELSELLLEHCLQSLSADITLRRAVE